MRIEDIEDYDDIADIVYDNQDLIEENYHSKDDQVLIHKELILKIISFINKPAYKDLDKNEFLKLLFRDVLELNKNDVMILKKGYIFIKTYDEDKRRKVSGDEVNTAANRFNGISEDELETFYKESFSKEEISNLFLDISEIFIERYFLDIHINNYDYEKDAFKYIQNIIMEEIDAEFDCSEEFAKGFSGYIFRIHFSEAFKNIAELLLREVAYSNKHIIEFLKYYSLDVVVVNGIKYKVPELRAESGLKWNVVSMMATVKTYVKTQDFTLDIEAKVTALNKKIRSLYVSDLSPIDFNALVHEKYLAIEEKIKRNNKRIDKAQDSIDLTKDETNKMVLKKELIKLKEDRTQLKDEKLAIKNKRISPRVINQYQELRKQVDALNRSTKAKYKILEQNKDSYDSILGALIKALISKKQAL